MQASIQAVLTWWRDLSSRVPGSPTTHALLVGALVGFVAYHLTKKRYRLPPGPWALPLLGNMWMMRDREEAWFVKLQRLAADRYGPVITVYLGNVRCVTLNNLNVITEALVNKGADFAGRPSAPSLDMLSGGKKNLVFADYSPAWKLRRKIALQAVRHYLRGTLLEKVVHREVSTTVDTMLAQEGPFDPMHHLTLLMFRIIDCTCLGEVKYQGCPPPEEVMKVFDEVAESSGSGFLDDAIPLLRFFPTRRLRRAHMALGGFQEYLRKNIEEHRKSLDLANIRDLTDSILVAQNEVAREERPETMAMFEDENVKHMVSDIYGAGIDTSRSTLAWALFLLAGHPEVQKRMQAEIDAASGPRLPGAGDRSKLQYSEAALYETMRLATVVPLAIPHRTLCDTTVGGYDVPKDTMVLANLWAVMHDPEAWERPHEFTPERFLDKEGQLTGRTECWLPFSLGRRSCIGESVSKPELLLILCCLLKRFSVSFPPGAEVKVTNQLVSLVMNPPKPFDIIVSPR